MYVKPGVIYLMWVILGCLRFAFTYEHIYVLRVYLLPMLSWLRDFIRVAAENATISLLLML